MHGHRLLISALRSRAQRKSLEGSTVIEIGTTRERVVGQGSSAELYRCADDLGMRFITVDMDPDNACAFRLEAKGMNLRTPIEAFACTGERFLRHFTGRIDYAYLDAFDFPHNKHSQRRLQSYRNHLHVDITWESCHRMHFECAQMIADKMPAGGMICFDDIFSPDDFIGKGATAIPYLLRQNYLTVMYVPHAMLLRRFAKDNLLVALVNRAEKVAGQVGPRSIVLQTDRFEAAYWGKRFLRKIKVNICRV